MIGVFVRHARAGDREKWEGDDRLRPLDRKGRRQAEGLVELLAEYPIERLLSSPYLRCVQSFEPLAQARGLEIEQVAELGEGSSARGGPAPARSSRMRASRSTRTAAWTWR